MHAGPPRPSDSARSIDAPFGVDFVHRLRFTRGLFDPANPILREVLDLDPSSPRRTVVFVDAGVAAAWPGLSDAIQAYAAAHPTSIRLVAPPETVAGGEAAKNSRAVVDRVLEVVHERAICRRSYVLAVGGGAMLDAVGFAAATAHRGVRLIRVPTTTLAQDDAAVGVKNGINRFGKKNFVGTFSPPWAVLNDEAFLETLSDRDFRAGLSETVKVALVRDAAYFDEIEALAPRLAARDMVATMPVIRRSAELHLRHIVGGGDPFELDEARPLDFGHWSAHKLEQMTGFAVPHGEAVGMGLALDCLYSVRTGRLAEADFQRVRRCMVAMDLPLAHAAMKDKKALLAGLEEFREHLGGRLTITLLRGIGEPEDVHEVDEQLMSRCVDEMLDLGG
ncbi:MAG: 3-dehydroquinate synthase [Phycisphaerales bacterium]|nr:3-dehydroquinate synthase [Phycisphaerales bacterium]